MMETTSLEMLAFNLKLLGRKSRKRLLISAGKLEDKKRMLPASAASWTLERRSLRHAGHLSVLRRARRREHRDPQDHRQPLAQHSDFPEGQSLRSRHQRPDRRRGLRRGLGRQAHPQARPSRTASRSSPIAMWRSRRSSRSSSTPSAALTATSSPTTPSPGTCALHFLEAVERLGGVANHHAHFDKAYLITPENLRLSQVDMQKKWELYRYLKENYTHDDLVERISRGVETMIEQGVDLLPDDGGCRQHGRAAARDRRHRGQEALCRPHPLRGWRAAAAGRARPRLLRAICRGLRDGRLLRRPAVARSARAPRSISTSSFELAKKLGKPVDVHVDQENNPLENETELLAAKTIEHGMQGRVFGVHAISVGAKEEREQDRIIEKVARSGHGHHHLPLGRAQHEATADDRARCTTPSRPFAKLRAGGRALLSRRRQCRTISSCRWSMATSGPNAGC